MAKIRRTFTLCGTCGGKTLDMDRHKNGASNSCGTRLARNVVDRAWKEMRALGRLPVSHSKRVLAGTKAQLWRAPVTSFGSEIFERDWTEAWVVAIAKLTSIPVAKRRAMIDGAYENPDLIEVIRAAYALAGIDGINNVLKSEV